MAVQMRQVPWFPMDRAEGSSRPCLVCRYWTDYWRGGGVLAASEERQSYLLNASGDTSFAAMAPHL
jgi:hypothetical protein